MYTPLYIKTDNSLQTSLIKVSELIEFAINNNIKSLTITDNNMYGVIDFYKLGITNDIKLAVRNFLSLTAYVKAPYIPNKSRYFSLLFLSLRTERIFGRTKSGKRVRSEHERSVVNDSNERKEISRQLSTRNYIR